MILIALLEGLTQAATAYMSLKKESLLYDLIAASEERQRSIIEKIEAYRDSRTELGAQNADLLGHHLLTEKKKYEKFLDSIGV